MFEYDTQYMYEALLLAREAIRFGDVPIGAVVVAPYGEIIGVGYNQVEQHASQDFHAELVALRAAGIGKQDWRLDGCTLYVTLEPCIMCMGALLLSRVSRLVYGSDSPLYGYTHTIIEPEHLYGGFLKNVTRGVLKDDSEALLQNFFAGVR
ncbi:MAG: Cytidine and deoxycytidylate deaminase zinc-binding domain-containing protein [candidate division TM6 bacterium GW2011_GWF2_43_17]|nr:MAG: Cytidine and deoxycytidylate deaminase zinc-binding domain-containing protein [candidate division TM6 bacterium GW2011_GWF2_43_17]